MNAAMRSIRRPEVLLGMGLNGFLVAMIVGRSRELSLLFAALVADAGLVVLLAWGRPARHRIGPVAAWGALVMFGAILAGYAVNLHRYEATFIFANVVSMLLALGMAYLLATRFTLDWRLVLASHAVVALLLLPIPIATGSWVWGRLVGGDIHPNYLGMIAMLAFLGGLGLRPAVLRWAALVAGGAVMVAASSRASMVASGVGVLAWGACRLATRPPASPLQTQERTRRTALLVLGALAAAVALWTVEGSILARALDAVLKLNDPYRGLETGASGRTALWSAALALWQEQPLLGVGFKGHTFFMPQNMPAHSAYLGMLAETGVLGSAGYLLVCGAAVAGVWRRRREPGWDAAAALAASYLVYGLVESRAVGFGNPYSILFLWIALDAARRPLQVQAARAPASPPLSAPEGSPP